MSDQHLVLQLKVSDGFDSYALRSVRAEEPLKSGTSIAETLIRPTSMLLRNLASTCGASRATNRQYGKRSA